MQPELKPSTYIDDVPESPIDAASVLSDEALAAGGLVPVTAFVRTRSSANASRLKKSRAKAADAGLRQLNVVVPVAAHAAIKAMARELQAGAALHDVLQAALANVAQGHESATGRPGERTVCKRPAALGRLARWRASWAGGLRAMAGWLGLR